MTPLIEPTIRSDRNSDRNSDRFQSNPQTVRVHLTDGSERVMPWPEFESGLYRLGRYTSFEVIA